MIKEYEKIPVVISAVQYTGENAEEIKEFMGSEDYSIVENEIIIHTLEGDMHVSLNDFVIRGIEGEFYPCKPNIFEKTYREVNNKNNCNFSSIVEKVKANVTTGYKYTFTPEIREKISSKFNYISNML